MEKNKNLTKQQIKNRKKKNAAKKKKETSEKTEDNVTILFPFNSLNSLIGTSNQLYILHLRSLTPMELQQTKKKL